MPHPVATLTQPRAFASFTGRRYGSFSEKGVATFTPTFFQVVEIKKFTAEERARITVAEVLNYSVREDQ